MDGLNVLPTSSTKLRSWSFAGYLAHGTATDYMHDILGVPFSFTWEIYGDAAADFHDCFRMFNPLTKDVLEEASYPLVESFTG